MTHIPVMQPRFPDLANVLSRFRAISDSGVFSNFGPQVKALEARYADFLGTVPEKVVLVANATVGITASIQALGGDKWVVPSWTFSATVAGTLAARVDVTLADITPESQWVKEPSGADTTEGVVKVAPFGSGFSTDVFSKHGRVVVDAAASIAAPLPPLRLLPASNCVVFSLHATKVLGIGEGGIVVCGSSQLADEIRSRTNFGFDSSRESQVIGTNSKMSEFAAAIGHAVLDNWPGEKDEWLEARATVKSLSTPLEHLAFKPSTEVINPYWIVLFNSAQEREKVENALADQKIQSRRWWANGAHRMPAYQNLASNGLFSTDSISERYLGLPFFRGITRPQVERVVSVVEESLEARGA